MIKKLNDMSPTLSIVIPVYNGAHFLEKCLPALVETADEETEIILVDNVSTDNSAETGERFGVKVISLKTHGDAGNSRNNGVAAAHGEIILFVDADVVVKKETVTEIRLIFKENPEFAAIFGSYDDCPAEPDFFSQYRNLMHHFFHQTNNREAETFWSGLGAIRRDVFIKSGGFKLSAIEDIDLGYRLKEANHRILLVRQLQAKHLKKWSFSSIVKTDFWGRAVPWAELLLLNPHIKADLNVKASQKISLLLTGMFIGSFFGLIWSWWTIFFSLGLLTVFAAINRDFYKFFLKRKGLIFTAGVLPMHLVYFVYCGAAFVLSWINIKLFGRTLIVK